MFRLEEWHSTVQRRSSYACIQRGGGGGGCSGAFGGLMPMTIQPFNVVRGIFVLKGCMVGWLVGWCTIHPHTRYCATHFICGDNLFKSKSEIIRALASGRLQENEDKGRRRGILHLHLVLHEDD